MKIISPDVHSVFDYAAGILLSVLPYSFLKHGSVAASFSIFTAVIQFSLAIVTRYRAGLFKFLSFGIHGFIEVGFAITFTIVALGFWGDSNPRVFTYFISFAFLYLFLFCFTDFRVRESDKISRSLRKSKNIGSNTN